MRRLGRCSFPSPALAALGHPLPQAGEGKKAANAPPPACRGARAAPLACRPVRAARDAGVLADPRASASREAEAERCFSKSAARLSKPQVRHFSGVPHAVFEACSARPPVDIPFRLPFSSARKPFHRFGGLDMPGRLAPPVRHAAKSPGDARLARRDRTASAAPAKGVRVAPQPATAPDPHSDALEAPLVDRGGCIIRQDFGRG